jgi:hypothetical protein
MVMKQSQWAIAAIVLAALVFVVTFAMNYLGGRQAVVKRIETSAGGGEIRFFWNEAPIGVMHGGLDGEEKLAGSFDFWFHNDQSAPVQVGVERTSCKCTAIELFVLPEVASRQLACEAATLVGIGFLGRVSVFARYWADLPRIQGTAGTPHELMRGAESVAVPSNAAGWVRMRWQGERAGAQALSATLTFDGKDSGKTAILRTRVFFHEALRVRPELRVGVLREEDLVKEVKQEIVCWSSTRKDLHLEVKNAGRNNPNSDPLVIGKPEKLSVEDTRKLEKENNLGKNAGAELTYGQVMCAYRIPVTLKAVAADGTPFDVGPISRRVTLSCTDISSEPKQVTIHGRVRGLVEIGNDEDGSEINFTIFPRSHGKSAKVNLQSEVPAMKLEFDRMRTPSFLDAKLSPPITAAGRQTWALRAMVKPGQASGVFPRREDPLYEDSAIYIKAIVPGKPVRWVRIAVQGTASEG